MTKIRRFFRELFAQAILVSFAAFLLITFIKDDTDEKARHIKKTLYVGESIVIDTGQELNKIKNKNDKLVFAAKDLKKGSAFRVDAKKKGKADVRVSNEKEIILYQFTIKPNKIRIKKTGQDGYFGIKVTNQRNIAFSDVYIHYTVKNKKKKILEDGTFHVRTLPPKSSIRLGTESFKGRCSLKKCKVVISAMEHKPGMIAKSKTKKIRFRAMQMPSDKTGRAYMKPRFRVKNKSKRDVRAIAVVTFTKGGRVIGNVEYDLGTIKGKKTRFVTMEMTDLSHVRGFDGVYAKGYAFAMNKE